MLVGRLRGNGEGGGGTVRRPREMVPMNFERVTVVDAILARWMCAI